MRACFAMYTVHHVVKLLHDSLYSIIILILNKSIVSSLVGFIALYVFYVFVVIVGRIVYQKLIKKKQLGTGDIPSQSCT